MGANSNSTSLTNTSSIAAADDDYFAASTAISQALSQLQLGLGTAAPSSLSLYLEPAFFPRAGMGSLPNPGFCLKQGCSTQAMPVVHMS